MILVCGEALVDLFVSPDPESGVRTETVLGGSPFNVAIGLSRLGASARFFGGVSKDAFGQAIVAKLKRERVDLSVIKLSDRLSTISVVSTDEHGQPTYAFHGDGKADRDMTPADLPELDGRIDAITVGSYAIAVPPVGDALLALVRREAGRTTISLDPNVRPTVTPDMQAWRKRFEAFLPCAAIVKASEEDLRIGYGDTHSIGELVDRWHRAGPSLVVVTRGENGASAFLRGHGPISVPGRPVKVVDTVGAGDTFHAALLAFLSRIDRLAVQRLEDITMKEVEDALRYAVAASAITCMRKGADLPTDSEVRDYRA